MKILKKNILNNSVVVIGNGPSATSWEAGELIDSFDFVVRFNNYEIDGYEKYVGTKTTHWVFNANKLVTWHRDYKQFTQVLVNCPNKFLRARTEWKEDLKSLYPNIQFIQRTTLGKFASFISLPKRKAFSAGISGICYFLLRCKKLYIHGFDFFQRYDHGILKLGKKSKHYFGEKSIPYRGHSPSKEKEFAQAMMEMGKIEVLQESYSG